ncbi:unnamed protein product, partial [Polarella glacialis]
VEPLSGAARAFWQAELYLRQLDAEAGDSAVEEAAGEAKERIEAETTDWQQALQGSILLARQNFISATRFGYFLRRSRQRYDLERSFAASGKESNLADWLGKARPADAVEMVRPASKEASSAIEHRATELFGAEEMLLRQLHGRPSDMAQLEMSKEGRKQLSLEAAAFGAGLFAAEAAAAGCYRSRTLFVGGEAFNISEIGDRLGFELVATPRSLNSSTHEMLKRSQYRKYEPVRRSLLMAIDEGVSAERQLQDIANEDKKRKEKKKATDMSSGGMATMSGAFLEDEEDGGEGPSVAGLKKQFKQAGAQPVKRLKLDNES